MFELQLTLQIIHYSNLNLVQNIFGYSQNLDYLKFSKKNIIDKTNLIKTKKAPLRRLGF